MKLIVFAYHSIGCACLERLFDIGDKIVAVVTHRDNPDENIWFDSVAELANSAGVPVFYAEDIDRTELIRFVESCCPDIVYSFYYRHILPRRILCAARIGAFNLHGSFLPKYRGRCPVNWAILNQEKKTGVTLHYMVSKPDAGDIVAQTEVAISPRETARSLYDKMIPVAAELIEKYHPLIRDGNAPRLPQDESQATYFGGRRPEDGKIDWTRPAAAIDALVRAVTHPYPGAFSFWRGRKFFVWETNLAGQSYSPLLTPGTVYRDQNGRLIVRCGDGLLTIIRFQLEGEEEQMGECLAPNQLLDTSFQT